MAVINIGGAGKVTLQTCLTDGQISKFNALFKHVIVDGSSAYLPLNELHGALLTNSKKTAQNIIKNYHHIVGNYLVYDPVILKKYEGNSGISPIGLYLLLEQLAIDNPRRAIEYKASLSLVAYIVATNEQIALISKFVSKEINAELTKLIDRLKKIHFICQISGEAFMGEEEKHAHHVTAISEAPYLMVSEENLLIVKKHVHDGYHNWISQQKRSINAASLMEYAKNKGYSTIYIKKIA
jgi:hypothetical protein